MDGLELDGRRILVIGGGGEGIGRAIVRRLAAAGATLAILDLDPDRARQAAAELASDHRTAFALVGDVRDPAILAARITDAVTNLNGLDALVTVTGGQVAFTPSVRLHEMTDTDWDLIYELNLRYVSRAVRQVLGIMLDQGAGGSIVGVGSVAGLMGAPNQGAYGVAKAGLLSLARTVAAEYSADRIRMNVVAAGAIATAVANTDAGDEWIDEIPMGRLGRTHEVANAVAYLVSDASAYMTGQAVVLDGGVSSRGPFQPLVAADL